MTVNSPLVAFGQAEPPLEIEIVLDLFELSLAHKKAGQEADHQRGHVLANRIPIPLELADQFLELRLAILATPAPGFEGLGHLVDVLDILSDWLLVGSDVLQSPVNASGQSAELLLCKPPFFASKFRWIDSRTSSKASAIRRPGGWRGPPWSSLRIPRTAAQYSSTTALAESALREGPFAGPTITVTVASGPPERLLDTSALCCLSTACSIFR